jgi:hypothetical protein
MIKITKFIVIKTGNIRDWALQHAPRRDCRVHAAIRIAQIDENPSARRFKPSNPSRTVGSLSELQKRPQKSRNP